MGKQCGCETAGAEEQYARELSDEHLEMCARLADAPYNMTRAQAAAIRREVLRRATMNGDAADREYASRTCADDASHSCVKISRLANEYATKLEDAARTLGVEDRALAELERLSRDPSVTACARSVYERRAHEYASLEDFAGADYAGPVDVSGAMEDAAGER